MSSLTRKPVLLGLMMTIIPGVSFVGVVFADSPMVRWERIEGIDPNATGQVLNGILPVTFPWTTKSGSVLFNVTSGRLQFHVEGLSMGASPTPVARIGTTGVIAEVKGTLMCQQSGDFVDSDAVELSEDGDAIFSGQLPALPYCESSDLIFLLRVAAVLPGAPPIVNRWLGYGAARKIR